MQPDVDCALHSLMLAACTVLALDTFVVCGLGANSSDCTSSSVCFPVTALFFFLSWCHHQHNDDFTRY